MRALLCLLVLGCGPKVDPQEPAFDHDLDGPKPQVTEIKPAMAERPVAAPGKGLRTGTIDRARLNAVLDGGPGQFLRQFEVTARLDSGRFVGWQLVQLIDRTSPLVDVDLSPGDVLLAINGQPISRPDQLQTVWDSLRSANELDADLWRGNAKLRLTFAIEPKLTK